MKQVQKNAKKLFSLLLCTAMLLGLLVPAQAKQAVTLRVAYYPLEGFFEYDEQGKEAGYGVEVLNKITQYTGIHFTYVPAESWEGTKQMLLEGKADLRMPATRPHTPSTTLGYTQHSIVDTFHAIMTLKSREDLIYRDTETFAGLRVGMAENMYTTMNLHAFLAADSITQENIILYDGYNAVREALAAGEVDAIVTNIMDLDSEMKTLDRFNSISNYISMTIDNPYLSILDDAISRIHLEDPTFFSDLYKEWFPERTYVPLTKEEAQYVASLGELSFSFRRGQGYLSDEQEDGSFIGFYPGVAALLSQKLGLPYEQLDLQSADFSGVVIFPDFYYDYCWADEWDADITEPYFTVHYYELRQKDNTTPSAECRVAAVKDFRVTQDYFSGGYREDQMVWCKDYADCVEAVYDGRADIAFINSYAAEYLLNYYRYSNFSCLLTDYSHKACLAVIGDETGLLASALNKTLSSLTQDELNDIMTDSMLRKPEQDFLTEWIYSNPLRSVLLVGIAAMALISVMLLISFAGRMKKQNTRLQQATRAKSDFLSRMSHDIRTPMNVIIGMSRMAQENKNPPNTEVCLSKIDIASEFLLGLINDVLDMERVESGRIELHTVPYSSQEFERYMQAVIFPLCEKKGVRLTFERIGEKEFTLMQDKLRINQVYFNLLTNAVKFTPTGGSILFQTVAERLPEGRMKVTATISDNGIGMSEEFQAHMFEPFTQEEQELRPLSQGTGLGLAIVKRMCDLMEMNLSVKSKLGEGSTFRLEGTFPLVSAAKGQGEVLPAPQEPVSSERIKAQLAGRHILVSEDHPLNLEIITRILGKAGMAVSVTQDGRRCTEVFAQSKIGEYAAILMDIRMPVMSGTEAARCIRRMERPDAAAIPIIAMTANALEEDRKASREAGMNEHLAKPIEPQKVYEALCRLLPAAGQPRPAEEPHPDE